MVLEVEAYCVKCKAPRKMLDPQPMTTRNGRPAYRGKCPVCGSVMVKIVKATEP